MAHPLIHSSLDLGNYIKEAEIWQECFLALISLLTRDFAKLLSQAELRSLSRLLHLCCMQELGLQSKFRGKSSNPFLFISLNKKSKF